VTPRRRWLGRAALSAWILLGIAAALAAPRDEIAGPATAEQLYGEARSLQSAAPGGLLAFAELLRRFGYDVRTHRAATAPDSDALVLLAPTLSLDEEERQALVAWIRDGGRLIYAPPLVSFEITSEDGETLSEDTAPIEDELTALVAKAGKSAPGRGGGADLWTLGLGRVAVLDRGGAVLTNAKLQSVGLRGQLGWLRWVLAGARRVAFDEVRIGVAGEMTLAEVIWSSRFWPAAVLAALAILLFVVARSVRSTPVQPAAPAGARNFGEHLDGVATLLEEGERTGLALQAMLEGTSRRLGPHAERDEARTLLEAAAEARRCRLPAARLARWAEALRRTEERLGA
jgi:hypothetical protein